MKLPIFAKIFIVFVIILSVIAAVLVGFLDKKAAPFSNVLLISIDTCRADFLSCYGFPLDTTPNIDDLAAEGILFERAVSPIPFTLPAHCSMLAGTIPPYHGVLDNGLFALSENQVTLAEILQEHEFSTGAFTSSFIINSDFGLDQGFNTYDDEFGEERNTMGILERQGDETTQLAMDWLQEHRDEKQFLFVHYFDPHFTYDAPEPFGSKFASAEIFKNFSPFKSGVYSAYAGEIAYTDHCIGKIIDKLKELKLYDSTLICITADHGEMLGQHKERSHGYFIYRGNINVPLVFRIPGRKKGLRIKNPAGLVDIVPTICSALGIEVKHEIQGRDLTAYYKDQKPYPNRYLFCMCLEPTKYNANPLLGVVKDQYKYIHTTHSELYDLEKDKFEFNNLIKLQPDRARIMQAELRQILEDTEAGKQIISGTGVDTETLAKLESLGYVGSSVDGTFLIYPDKADPKELIDYHALGGRVGFYIQTGDYEAAEKACLKMIEENPDLYMGYYKMAISLAHQEKYSESIDYLLKMTELEHDNVFAYSGLADGYIQLEQYDNSIRYALKSLELKRDFILSYYYLGVCYYEKGMFDEFEKHLAKEIVEHPRYPKITALLAEKLIEKGQIRRAYKKYLNILELDPDSLDGLNSVAWLQAASMIDGIRNPQQAVGFALKACQVSDNRNPEALDTLAVTYAATGDFRKAIETSQKAIEVANFKGDDALAGRIQERQNLYRQGKVYVDTGLNP
jgi:arylsulfatase A-like enzyme